MNTLIFWMKKDAKDIFKSFSLSQISSKNTTMLQTSSHHASWWNATSFLNKLYSFLENNMMAKLGAIRHSTVCRGGCRAYVQNCHKLLDKMRQWKGSNLSLSRESDRILQNQRLVEATSPFQKSQTDLSWNIQDVEQCWVILRGFIQLYTLPKYWKCNKTWRWSSINKTIYNIDSSNADTADCTNVFLGLLDTACDQAGNIKLQVRQKCISFKLNTRQMWLWSPWKHMHFWVVHL